VSTVSWPSARITVSASRVSNRPVPWGRPCSSSSWISTVRSVPSIELMVRSQLIIGCPPPRRPAPRTRARASGRGCGGRRSRCRRLRAGGRRGRRPSRCCRRRTPRRARRGGAACPTRRRAGSSTASMTREASCVGDVDAAGQVGTDGDEDGVEGPVAISASRSSTRWPCSMTTPRSRAGDLGVEHGARQAVGRDAVAHHPARLAPDVADRHRRARGARGGRPRTARSGRADDEDAVAGGRRWRVEGPALLDGLVAEEPLDGVDGHGAVELGTVARGSRRGGSRPGRGWREGVVERQPAPGGLGVAGLARASHAWMFSPAGQPALHGGRRSTWRRRKGGGTREGADVAAPSWWISNLG
jgi:hypothetical protein